MADAYKNPSISHQELGDPEFPESCSDPRFFNFNVHKLHNHSVNHTCSEFRDHYKANKQRRNHRLPHHPFYYMTEEPWCSSQQCYETQPNT